MNNNTAFVIGQSVKAGWKSWLTPSKPVTLTWGQMRHRVRVTSEWCGDDYFPPFVLSLVEQFTKQGGRVVVLDPLVDTTRSSMDHLWMVLHHAYPGMKTVCWMDQVGLLESFMSDELPPEDSRVLFVAQSEIRWNDEDLIRIVRAEPFLRVIHQAAGRKLGAPLEDGGRRLTADSVAPDCIPTLIVTQHLLPRVRDHGMYQRHLRAANMAILDLIPNEPALPPGRDNPACTSIVFNRGATIRRDGPGENGASEAFGLPRCGFPQAEEQPHWNALSDRHLEKI